VSDNVETFVIVEDINYEEGPTRIRQGCTTQHGQEGCHSCFWLQLPHGTWQGQLWKGKDINLFAAVIECTQFCPLLHLTRLSSLNSYLAALLYGL